MGVEKETLRVRQDGGIAQTDHPTELGAAIANPFITTDYSEALLEIVTPPLSDIDTVMKFLADAHRFIYPRLPADEFLWSTSMPCILKGTESIPVGRYGNSNAGLMKHVYRKGLGLRYGKAMQTIAGVHFNFSWPAEFWPEWHALQQQSGRNSSKSFSEHSTQNFITEQYFHMTRNLLRFGWLVPYLFGSSPAICKTFLGDAPPTDSMKCFQEHTFYEPYGTSLRMGDIGYQYRKDSSSPINVSYSSVDEYVRDLLKLVSTPNKRYEEIGLRDEKGDYQQINTNRLQIENEYYSSVRPKQIPNAREMPLMAMANRGIRYLELRSIDVNVFEPLGVESEQLHFLEVFMLFSLLHESPEFNSQDMSVMSDNISNTAHRGRDPKLKLHTPCSEQKELSLAIWGRELLEQMTGPADILDQHSGSERYSRALATQLQKMDNPELTPSARVLREMKSDHNSFYEFARSWSMRHLKSLQDSDSAADYNEQVFLDAAATSHAKAEQLERDSSGSLQDYLDDHFAQLANGDLDQFRAASS